MSTARTIRRNRLKDQKRLALKMRAAAERGDGPTAERLEQEAYRRGYLTTAQVASLQEQRAYVSSLRPREEVK